jgi:hypothetical protein
VSAAPRQDGKHEHEFEPQLGLPEPLPPSETILWQGAPDWRALARRTFHVRKLAVYFGAILAIRAGLQASDGTPAGVLLLDAAKLAPLALAAIGMAALAAWLTARTTVYTITDRRVVMRVGIVLSLTFNLPMRRIEAAGLRRDPDGSGDIPLTIGASDKIAYVHLWPHARPWQVARPQPMLRGLVDVDAVAGVLATAWAAANGTPAGAGAPVRAAREPHDAFGQPAGGTVRQPALAGH